MSNATNPDPTNGAAPLVVDPRLEWKKEACKTYIEQTKLLVTLASAFLIAPAAILGLLKDHPFMERWLGWQLIGAETAFVVSVLSGYVALSGITGSQDRGEFDVFRKGVRWSSLIQFFSYLLGMMLFGLLTIKFFGL
jgi:hypothetical protein